MARIGASYARARIFPIRDERTLEEFMINRFGRELYTTFFEEYTEKVWGVPCAQIRADWGAQRIKGLSVSKAVGHALRGMLPRRGTADIAQARTETSLIERFLYPKFGPGQLWEEVARMVEERGGAVHLRSRVVGLDLAGGRIVAVTVAGEDGARRTVPCEHFISTMPVRDLVAQLGDHVSAEARSLAAGLLYRDFITVGVLLRRRGADGGRLESMPDNWIYVQEPDVRVGRLQIFNNWSPYMVADPSKTWIGLEYFCYQTDALWKMADEDLKKFAIAEVEKIGILRACDVTDAHVVRVPKTYPAYFGTYDRFHVIREFLDHYHNLYLVGRNGMHKYNNQDHSMLTAMTAVDNILAGVRDKDNVWSINTEMEYHEEETKKDEARVSGSPTKNTDSVEATV
jgi:protoporphyrinogen oxidase